jgi:hypothetical protein
MTPEFHPAAAQELAAAALEYEKRAAGLGRDLVMEARRLTTLLCDTPQIGEPLDKVHRRVRCGDVLRVIAVAHRRRRPGYWRHRT